MGVKIYHNPRCSKSRQTLEILQQNGTADIQIVEYLKQPPSIDEIRALVTALADNPRQIMRTGEKIYKELNLAQDSVSEEQLIQAMHEHPILIERPIVTTDKGARIGRPPEAVKEVL